MSTVSNVEKKQELLISDSDEERHKELLISDSDEEREHKLKPTVLKMVTEKRLPRFQ